MTEIPEWINRDDDFEAQLLDPNLYDDSDDDLLAAEFLQSGAPELDTQSEVQISEVLKEDLEVVLECEKYGTWVDFVKFVNRSKREMHGKGYATPQECYLAYRHYLEWQARGTGRPWKLPHIKTMAHPAIERMRYPAPNEPITDEFRAYAYYALQEEGGIEGLDVILGDEKIFNELLQYAQHYKLWTMDWPSIVDTFMGMFSTKHVMEEGTKPYQKGHVVPLRQKQGRSRSYEELVLKTAKDQREISWKSREENKERALQYLRARRHHEHDRRYNPDLPEFSQAPPTGMERIARSQMDYDYSRENKYAGQVQETIIFEDDEESDVDYLEMLGEGREVGWNKNAGIMPKMAALYKESLIDRDVVEHEKRRRERQQMGLAPLPRRTHKEPDQILVTEPFGREKGAYLTRVNEQTGPLPAGEQINVVTSDDQLARISTLSLAELVSNTDHNTDMERRRLILEMDQCVRYNKKLIAIFKDVIDHIGPDAVAPPTEWDFSGAQQFLSKSKLEYEKWARIAALKASDKERKDLFMYYTAVKQHISSTAQNIAHEARYVIKQLTSFVETVKSSDPSLVKVWFDDAVGPSIKQYLQDMDAKEQQINNLINAIEKVKCYKTLMSYKDTDLQTLFDDDIYHDLEKLQRELENIKETIAQKERYVETTLKSNEYIRSQATELEKSAESHSSQSKSLDVYTAGLKRNIDAERGNAERIRAQIAQLTVESDKNQAELKQQGIACSEPCPNDLELVKETKEMLETTNAKLLSDVTHVDQELALYEDLVAKRTAEIERKQKAATETDELIKVYEKQEAAKGVFITKISHENNDVQEKLAEQLAKAIKAKAGDVLKESKEVYESDECSALRGQRGHAEEMGSMYNEYMDSYNIKIEQLSTTLENYQEVREQRAQLEGVVKGASEETANWKKMLDGQKKKHRELSQKFGRTHTELQEASTWKDELAKILAETEKKVLDNERFKIHADATITAAKDATTEPMIGEYSSELEKSKVLTMRNEKSQLKIKKTRQEMRKKANVFRHLLRN